MQKKIVLSLIIIAIAFNVLLSSFSVIQQDINFNTDIARDFLLIEEIVETQNPTLLGPRSGGISGVFHGPLWLYINIPAYIIGNGNPVVVGWWWVVLSAVGVLATIFSAKKLFKDNVIALVSGLLVSALFILSAASLFNPFGAVMLSPLFFYLFYSYTKDKDIKYLLLAYFILGLIIQFQIAFGLPILVVSILLLMWDIYKSKKYLHFLSPIILGIPLSTYVLFELRHGFLQLNSLISYVTGRSGGSFSYSDMVTNRIDSIIGAISLVPDPTTAFTVMMLIVFGYVVYKGKKGGYKSFYIQFLFFFFGFWLITLLFRGVVWGYYYWPFMPLVAILLATGYKSMHKVVYGVFIVIVMGVLYSYTFLQVDKISSTYINKDTGSWAFNDQLAKTIFDQNDREFGYYIYSTDEFGYNPRYALNYNNRINNTVQLYPYEKKPVTYLIISPGDGEDKHASGDWWRLNRVKIANTPEKVWDFPNGFRIEKYLLTAKEIAIPSDPNIIDSLIFR